jgi:hypothetical protein
LKLGEDSPNFNFQGRIYFSEVKKMTENESMFNSYGDVWGIWSGMTSSWTKAMENFSGAFKVGKEGNGFNPWHSLEGWNKAGDQAVEMLKKISLPHESMEDLNKALAKGTDSYRKIWDSYIRNALHLFKEGYQMDVRSLVGEEIDTDNFFEALNDAYHDVSATVVDALKGTPFEGIKEIDDAVKKSLDMFSNERETTKALIKDLAEFKTNMAKLSATAAGEAANAFSDVKEKGTLSLDVYKEMVALWAETCKRSMDRVGATAGMPTFLLSECQKMMENSVCLAGKNIDVLTTWMEISLKSSQAVAKSAEEIGMFAGEVFKGMTEKESPSQTALYKKWAETLEKATRDLIEGTHFNGSIPKFITLSTDCIKSANEHCKNVAFLPYAIKTDMSSAMGTPETDAVRMPLPKQLPPVPTQAPPEQAV